MSDKIRKEDIFDPNLLEEVNKITAAVLKLNTAFDSLKDAHKKTQGIKFVDSKSLEEFDQVSKKAAQAQDDLVKASKAVKQATDEEIKAKIKLQQATDEEIKAKIKLQQANAIIKKELKDLIILEDKEAGTLQKLTAINSQLTRERSKLNLETTEGKKRLKEINDELDKNNKIIKDNSDKLTKQRLNVGNYTESVKEAIEASGIFGEAFEKLNKFLKAGGAFLRLIEGIHKEATIATQANTTAIEANTIAVQTNNTIEQENIVITAANTIADKENTLATELNTIATEEGNIITKVQTAAIEETIIAKEAEVVATQKLSTAKRILNAITSPTGLIIASVIALTKVIYDNLTATEEQRDVFEASKEAAEQAARFIDVLTVSNKDVIKSIYEEVRAEQALEDARINQIVNIQKLNTEAQKARNESEKEGLTTQERIDKLTEFTDKLREQRDVQIELAREETKIASDKFEFESRNQILTRETRQRLNEAKAKELELDAEFFRETRRVERRKTSLIEQDRKDRLKLTQDAQKEEIESTRITTKQTSEIILQQKNKDLKLEKIRFQTDLKTIEDQQAKLGAVGAEQQAEFDRQIEAKKKIHKSNILNINQKAFDEEKKMLEKLASIERDISSSLAQDQINDTSKLIEKRTLDFDESTNKILNKGQLFNKKIFAERQIQFDDIQANIEAENILKENQLIENERIAEINANNTIEDTVLLNEEIKKLQNQLNIDIGNLEDEGRKNHEAREKKKLEEDRKITNARIQNTIKEVQLINTAAQEGLRQIQEKQKDAADAEINLRKSTIDKQLALAQNGQDNQLAFEEKKLAEAELAKRNLLEKQARIAEAFKLTEVFLNSLNQKMSDGKTPYSQAAAQAFDETFLAKGITRLIAGSAFEGTENTGEAGNMDSKGGKLWMIHPKERIMTAEQNAMIGDISNDDLARLAANRHLPNYMMDAGIMQDISKKDQVNTALTLSLISEVKALNETVKNKTEYHVDWNSHDGRVEQIVKNGMKQVINHIKTGHLKL